MMSWLFTLLSLRNLREMAQRTGLEPATLGVTGRYSNQLNYRCITKIWWALTGSNRRHSACKADALPTELSALSEGKQNSVLPECKKKIYDFFTSFDSLSQQDKQSI